MSPNSEPPPKLDPETWVRRFDQLVELVKHNADVARDAAADSVIRVTAENARAQEKIRRELVERQDQDRRHSDVLHRKVDLLGAQVTDVLNTLNKLTTAKLMQVAITALILAALVVIGIKALGG